LGKGVINWGVLSTARIGVDWVIPAINKTTNGKVAAIASRDENKARRVAQSLAIPKYYGDYLKLLESKEIDAVYISLPNSMHHKWTILAAKYGKHVLCEKPLGLNTRESEEMAAACEKAGVRLCEEFMYRFYPHITKLKELIDDGRIGKVSLIRSAFTFKLDDPNDIRLNKELGGGSLYDVGCYCVNFSRLIAGCEPVKVHATAHIHKNGVDDVFVGIMQFPNDEIAVFDSGFQTMTRHSVEVLGENGTLEVAAAFEPALVKPEIISQTSDKTEIIHCENVDPYSLLAEDFADSILSNREQRYSVSDTLSNMRALDMLYNSVGLP
jgi:D-xylose 1-dehydrogenase (NADP+, D-xylono-1,5-lactone-forming)